jgi:peptidase E
MSTLVLTSDFPSTPTPAVVDLMKSRATAPRIAWIAPETASGRERFPAAVEAFEKLGLATLDLCDIDDAPDADRLANLHEYEIVYLSGGDPLAFRRNILRTGLAARLQECMRAGRLIVAASGGALQLTLNVSLVRLLTVPLEEVLVARSQYDGLGFVPYELLPHSNRCDASFIQTVCRYSAQTSHDVLALTDGAAVVHTSGTEYYIIGQAARIRGGEMSAIDAGTTGV